MQTLTLDDLLVKPQKINVADGVDLWIRPLTQIERELSQGAARSMSRALRKKLLDPKAEEHKLLIKDELAEYTREQLEELWVGNRLIPRAGQISRDSLEARDQTFIPEPEGADVTSSDIEKHETRVEEVEEEREERVREAVQSAQKQLQEEASKMSLDEIGVDARDALLEFILSKEWQQEFAAQMIARATFLDKKLSKPAFKDTNEVKELRPDILKLITESHFGLLVPPESVKN